MDKKELQEQRMKGYFIEATKEMLKGEGLKSISVRSIADRAGYSFATMYNYFRDVKDLIFVCVKDFQEECAEFVKVETINSPNGLDKIRDITKAYIKYFVQYPGIFDLFFLEKMTDIGSKQPTSELIYSFLDQLCADEWKYCIDQKIITSEEAESIKLELKFMSAGMLLFYNNRRQPTNYSDFSANTNKLLDQIFKDIRSSNSK
jgi:AcrR family transcriptional regulator